LAWHAERPWRDIDDAIWSNSGAIKGTNSPDCSRMFYSLLSSSTGFHVAILNFLSLLPAVEHQQLCCSSFVLLLYHLGHLREDWVRTLLFCDEIWGAGIRSSATGGASLVDRHHWPFCRLYSSKTFHIKAIDQKTCLPIEYSTGMARH
jgi:hypothetical protein